LKALGFDLNFRKVPQDTLYTRFCNVPGSDYVICPNVGWFRDFTIRSRCWSPRSRARRSSARATSTTPCSTTGDRRPHDKGVDDPGRLGAQRGPGEINRRIVAQAPAIPYSWDDSFSLASKDIRGVMNGYTTVWDFAFSSVK
jgi:peptide/nickel transport system substrate-binding protein